MTNKYIIEMSNINSYMSTCKKIRKKGDLRNRDFRLKIICCEPILVKWRLKIFKTLINQVKSVKKFCVLHFKEYFVIKYPQKADHEQIYPNYQILTVQNAYKIPIKIGFDIYFKLYQCNVNQQFPCEVSGTSVSVNILISFATTSTSEKRISKNF